MKFPKVAACFLALLLTSCDSQESLNTGPAAVDVEILTVVPQDTPVVFQFVGQSQSSRQVEIRARVDGFLEEIAYQEGALVKEGQILFELDKKPFAAALQSAEGQLALEQARLETNSAHLRRIRPLAEQDAVAQKVLDDAVGAEKQAQAAVLSTEGLVQEAKLKLSYATIHSPLNGLASKAEKREGSYIPAAGDSLLTYVAQLDPVWVNFSISENQVLGAKGEMQEGNLKPPADDNYEVEVVFADGTSHPHRGIISFAEPNLDPKTGTFLVRAELANPEGDMRPGQFVRVRLHGAMRPNAIVVPQSAVIRGAKGHFVWVAESEDKAKIRDVDLGPWHEDGVFVERGLNEGDRVITSGYMKLTPDTPIRVVGS